MRFACDTHIHFYDHRYPAAPNAVLRPPDATPADYCEVGAELGTERAVIVQPTTYGLDNRCQLEAMEVLGSAARGVVSSSASSGIARSSVGRGGMASRPAAGVGAVAAPG